MYEDFKYIGGLDLSNLVYAPFKDLEYDVDYNQIKRVIDFIINILSDDENIQKSLKIRGHRINSHYLSIIEDMEFMERSTVRGANNTIITEGSELENHLDWSYIFEVGSIRKGTQDTLLDPTDPRLYFKFYYVPELEIQDPWRGLEFSSQSLNYLYSTSDGSNATTRSTFVSYFIDESVKKDDALFTALIMSVIKHYINFILHCYGLPNCLDNNTEQFKFHTYNYGDADKMSVACLLYLVYFKAYEVLCSAIDIDEKDSFFNVLPPNTYFIQIPLVVDPYKMETHKCIEIQYKPIYDFAIENAKGRRLTTNYRKLIKWIYDDIL